MYLYLTTTGRVTGQAREIEIWFTERDGHFYCRPKRDNGFLSGVILTWPMPRRNPLRVSFRTVCLSFAPA
jgi:hypothetical protein